MTPILPILSPFEVIHILFTPIEYDNILNNKGGPSGGSNGLQIVQFFFCELFMIFVHKKKSLNRKLEKSDFLVHPSVCYDVQCLHSAFKSKRG